jgi:hypothetical protein
MISETQAQEITAYLLEQKLPLDILMEIQDHIISQISDLEREQSLSFKEAFQMAKDSWRSELRPYWNGSWDLEDRNDLVRNFEKSVFKEIGWKSVKYTLGIMMILVLLANIFSLEFYQNLFLIFSLTLISYTIIPIVYRWKTFRLPNKYYPKYMLTLYQNYVILPLSGAYFLFKFIEEYDKFAYSFYKLFYSFEWKLSYGLLLILTFVFFTALMFSIIAQKVYLKRIALVKPFLDKLSIV